MRDTKYFITGGGTGGHIYPAIAVIRELVKYGIKKDTQIFYLGNKKNLEYQIANSEGLNFLDYKVCGMPRKFSFGIFKFAFELFFATLKALFYALRYRPKAIFATGGYVCAPILFAAKMLKIPYILHDCDAHPGVVSRTFAKGAKAVSLSFNSAKKMVNSENVYIFGNPIRADFSSLTKTQARDLMNIRRQKVVLIMGGSLGAKKINDATFKLVENLKDNNDIQIIWQTGKKNYDEVMKKLKYVPENLIIAPYFENMALPLISADVVISRAGSLSLSEICAAGVPSILVPFPYAAADHQRKNAKSMVDLGASVYLDDNDCNEETLWQKFSELFFDEQKLSNMVACAKENAKYDASKNICELIIKTANREV